MQSGIEDAATSQQPPYVLSGVCANTSPNHDTCPPGTRRQREPESLSVAACPQWGWRGCNGRFGGLPPPIRPNPRRWLSARLGDAETGIRATGSSLTEAKAGNQSRRRAARKGRTSATTEGVSTSREGVSYQGEIWR